MNNQRYAAIDIGTNTVLMVIGEKHPKGEIEILRDENTIVRLGKDVGKTRQIQPDALLRAERTLTVYKSICDELGVANIAAAGTSAMREADNRDYVCKRLSEIISAKIKIISGEKEALLSFIGAIENDVPAVVIDIGGGSTEIILGVGEILHKRVSLPIGAVKITERFFPQLPPSSNEIDAAIEEIGKYLRTFDKNDYIGALYAVAGTPTTLAAAALEIEKFNKEKIDGFVLNIDKIEAILKKLFASTLSEIKQIKGIHPDRADIITAGALILREGMNYLGKKNCSVSVKGLRYGILKQFIEGKF